MPLQDLKPYELLKSLGNLPIPGMSMKAVGILRAEGRGPALLRATIGPRFLCARIHPKRRYIHIV